MARYVQQNYIPKLVQLFRTCEDLENLECLRLIFKIVKGISELQYHLLIDSFMFFISFSLVYFREFRVTFRFYLTMASTHHDLTKPRHQ